MEQPVGPFPYSGIECRGLGGFWHALVIREANLLATHRTNPGLLITGPLSREWLGFFMVSLAGNGPNARNLPQHCRNQAGDCRHNAHGQWHTLLGVLELAGE